MTKKKKKKDKNKRKLNYYLLCLCKKKKKKKKKFHTSQKLFFHYIHLELGSDGKLTRVENHGRLKQNKNSKALSKPACMPVGQYQLFNFLSLVKQCYQIIVSFWLHMRLGSSGR